MKREAIVEGSWTDEGPTPTMPRAPGAPALEPLKAADVQEGERGSPPSVGREAAAESVERRTAARVALEVEVEVSLSSDSQFFAGLSGDISTGGLFVHTYKRYGLGTHLTIAFSLPGGEIRASGVVRWVRPATGDIMPGVGVAFETLSEAERATVEAFCRQRPPLYHDDDI